MKYRTKADKILTLEPDILIVPECENPDHLKFGVDTKIPTDHFWYGDNPHKGLGVFSYSKYRFRLQDWHNPDFKMVLPILVTCGQTEFTLFAIWANNPEDKNFQYVGQVWKAINYYQRYLSDAKILLLGDFNSNTIWDKPKREGNHSTVVNFLEQKGIYSLYHRHFDEVQGKETQPTLFMYRHQDRPYHIDYCFASKDFIENLKSVEVGRYEEWKEHSDHMPLTIDFN